MLKETQTRLSQGLKVLATTLLLISSNQTASSAGNISHNFQKELKLSEQYRVDVSLQSDQSTSSSEQYSIRVYNAKTPKLISAITRPLTGHISDIIVEDINDDKLPEVLVMMEKSSQNKQYLMIDTFSFNGRNMIWKQHLPKGFVGVKSGTYLKKHEVPSNLHRNTATVLLDR